jgi:3-oxoacyl-(acyl-carrier-protein) synthase
MSLAIRGMGWITPLGDSIAAVWEKLLDGEEAKTETISSQISPRTYRAFRVPETALVHPRLRRSSAISRFAVAAGLAALEDAGVTPGKNTERIALIFAVSNGGVIYTKRFYHEIVASGAQAASPLLFPETVFNAPASHLAAILDITGTSYTLVGDGAVGLLALKMAEDLMQNEALEYCIIVGAEEVDWLLCDAYRKWRLLRSAPPIEPFHESPKGMILSEGAGAIVVGRTGAIQIEKVAAGGNYPRRKDAAELLSHVLAELGPDQANVLIGSANGTFVDLVEREAALRMLPDSLIYTMKPALGESVGTSALWQVIVGAQTLLTHQVPPLLHSGLQPSLRISATKVTNDSWRNAIISTCGLNQQVAGLRLSVPC